MMPLRAGTVFARVYEIVRPISAGGMGIVYEVLHLGTRRRRALKVMLAHIVTDARMRERFSLEAVVTADIESENLTEIFDAGIDPETDCPYLVMELLRGEDLGARLKRGERASGAETLMLMEQVCRALEKTHAKGVIHRDLKPDNLFMCTREDGSPLVKILDFGIAKLIKADANGPQATTKTFGTPYYMAREQITGESALIGPASDLYAVAHIAFALLTGRPYFEDEAKQADGNMLALLMAVGRGVTEAASARALRRGVELPRAFDEWFRQATAPSSAERFRSARLMMDGLRQALREPVREIGPDPDAPVAPRGAVSATSDRHEQSFPKEQSQPSTPELHPHLHQTGAPQSITKEVPAMKGRRTPRVALLFAGVALAGVGIGVAAWRLSPGATAASSDGAASSAPVAAASEQRSAAPATSEPVVVAATATAEVPSASTGSATATATVTAAATAARPPVGKPIAPRPTATGAPGPVWETR